MSRVFQRTGRTGYYLGVAVPRSLRSQYSKSEVVRKLGNTHKAAIAIRSKVESEIQREFGAALNTLTLAEKIATAYKDESLGKLPAEEKENIKNSYPLELDKHGNPTDQATAALWLSLDGKNTWQQWVNRRIAVEGVSKSTIINWRSRLKSLAEWAKTDYLAELTKRKAIEYKEFMLHEGKQPSSVKNAIGCFNGFWNWAIDNDLIQTNVWSGLKKRLPDAEKKPLPDKEVFNAATRKAATTSANRKTKDYQFLIQRYTGCRQGEAAGLRHCDVDLKEKVIHFKQWEKIVTYEKLRGGKRKEKQIRNFKTGHKDERSLPMSCDLFEAIKDMKLIKSDDPIWPLRYKSTNDSWGAHWVSDYPNKYKLRSHDLRRYAVTKLTLSGVTPFIIFEITRHKIEGMSEVVSMYTRPSTKELREAMELLK